MKPAIRCTRCSQPYPEAGVPFLCPSCGGVYDFEGPFNFCLDALEDEQPGIWRYRHAFALPAGAPVVSLGEGNTPLLPLDLQGEPVWLKLESLNPTGSYKDRGSAALISQLLARGAQSAIEDSSGNAGASFAAYAARAGMGARVFVPDYAAGPKRSQIETYGAELVSVPGPRSAAAEAVLREAGGGSIYASHAYLPFGLAGIASLAYEIWQQLGGAPGSVIAPVGHGGLLLGIVRGFAALQHAGLITQLPYYVGVQAEACAPVCLGFHSGREAMASAEEGQTVAEGVRVSLPVRGEALLREIPPEAGTFLAVPEDEILPAYHELARKGFHVEPTSALVWCAYQKLVHRKMFAGSIPGPVVLVMTGAGLKYRR
jgi:threonine synthase